MIEDNDYHPPQHVVEEWKKHCKCCPNCSDHPCDGVSAGGMCDDIECICDNDDLDYKFD